MAITPYKKIALEFTMDDKAVTVETLVRELERQRLLTSHLNLAGSNPKPNRQVDVRLTNTPTDKKICYAFQRGECHREDCPFLHEKGGEEKASKNSKRSFEANQTHQTAKTH